MSFRVTQGAPSHAQSCFRPSARSSLSCAGRERPAICSWGRQPLSLPAGPADLWVLRPVSIRSIIRARLSIPPTASGGNSWRHWGCHHCGYVASPATLFTPRRTSSRSVASRRLRARLRAVVSGRNGRARLNECDGRLGCRGRAGGSHEAYADERGRTQAKRTAIWSFHFEVKKDPGRLAVSRSNDQSRQPGAMRPAGVRPAEAMGTHSFRGR